MDENPSAPSAPSPGGKPGGRAGRPVPLLRVGSPASLLAVIPGLLGFHPARSLVVVGAGPPRGRIQVAFRYDLPEPPDPEGAAKIATHAAAVLTRQQLTLAVVVGYGTGPMVTPVADALVAELRRADITLHDMLRVEGGRYWSYSCQDPRCCPAEGVPFDVTSHPAAETMIAAGSKVLRDRAALAATIAPVGGLAAESMGQATRQAERHVTDLIRKGADQGGMDAVDERLVDEGLRAVGEAIDVYRRGGKISSDAQVARLAVSLADLRVRDDAWARMEPEHVDAHLRLWTDLVRRAPARYVPAPAALLAFTAWQAGNGALANIAADRALSADPEYSMALLLQEAVDAGLPPSAARLPMTPEEVAASYARSAGRPAGPGPRKPAGPARGTSRRQPGPSGGQPRPSTRQAGPSTGQSGPSTGQAGPSRRQAGPGRRQAGPSARQARRNSESAPGGRGSRRRVRQDG
jgi:Domain of unknown function (DUF4192)